MNGFIHSQQLFLSSGIDSVKSLIIHFQGTSYVP